MKKLSEHLQENIPGVYLPEAKKVIEEYRNYLRLIHSSICSICHCELTQEEKAKTTNRDFHYCCDNHRGFSNAFQADLVRAQLGISISKEPLLDL